MDILRCMNMFLISKILDLACVQNYMRCILQNKSDTKLFRVYVFTVFTIKRPQALASLAPFGLLIVKTVTNKLLTITKLSILIPTLADTHVSYRSFFFLQIQQFY